MMMRHGVCLLFLSFSAPVVAQATTITEERVRAAVTWLASDERKGRDTGSPELVAAGDWIAARFQKSGLQPLREDSWFHDFSLPAAQLDSDAVSLKLSRKAGGKTRDFTFEAGRDVRLWRPSDGLKGEEKCTVALAGDPVLQRLLRARSARRPIIIEVGEDHAYWLQAKGKHSVISGRRKAARPILLVREGLLPVRKDQDGVEWTATWSVAAAEEVGMPLRNVMALLPAQEDSDRKDEYIVVSSHYDHVGVGVPKNGDPIYNGADDNATGTTAVILLAEAMAKMPTPRRNVLFVCFSAEERGLLGSRAFCDKPPISMDQVVANLNIEMIGRPEEGKVGKAWVTGSQYSDFAAICGAALAKTGGSLVDFRMASQLFGASDNFSFVRQGVVAHSISAGSLHDDYHQPGDEVGKLDIPHMTKIIRGLLDVTLELASRDDAPCWNEKGKTFIQRIRR